MQNPIFKPGDCVRVTIDGGDHSRKDFHRVGHVEHVTTTGNLRVRMSIGWLHLAAPQDCEKLTPSDREFIWAPVVNPMAAQRSALLMRRAWT